MLHTAQFDLLLAIYNKNYRDLQVECSKFNASQPKENRIYLKQKRTVMLNELMRKLEILGATVPRKPPVVIPWTSPVDADFIESLSSLTISAMVTQTLT